MKKFLCLLLLGAGVLIVLVYAYLSQQSSPSEKSAEPITTAAPISYSWRLAEADDRNLDGFPKTTIFVVTVIEEKQIERLVDTVDGGCSILTDENQESVQCYYAGLGQKYRIVEHENTYNIERKLFEEALPTTAIPNYEWEVILKL